MFIMSLFIQSHKSNVYVVLYINTHINKYIEAIVEPYIKTVVIKDAPIFPKIFPKKKESKNPINGSNKVVLVIKFIFLYI